MVVGLLSSFFGRSPVGALDKQNDRLNYLFGDCSRPRSEDWLTPRSANSIAVAIDDGVVDGCESMGSPTCRAAGQSEQVRGKVLPAWQG